MSNTLYSPYLQAPQPSKYMVGNVHKTTYDGEINRGLNKINNRMLMNQNEHTINNYHHQPSMYAPDRVAPFSSTINYCSPDELYQMECARRIEAEQLALRRRQLEYLTYYRQPVPPYQNHYAAAPKVNPYSEIHDTSFMNNSHCAPKGPHEQPQHNTHSYGVANAVQDLYSKASDCLRDDEFIVIDDELPSPASKTSDEPLLRYSTMPPPDLSLMPPLTRIADSSTPTPPDIPSQPVVSTEEVKQKKKPAKIRCSVCGEDAICKSYGAVCCDSCRLFFRRTIVKDAHKAFKCSSKGRCIVTGRHRSRCQFCRFQRCLGNGMRPEHVLKNANDKNVTSESLIVPANSFNSASPQLETTYLTVANYNETLSNSEAFELHGVVLQYEKMREGKAPAPQTPITSIIALFGDILAVFLTKNLFSKSSKINGEFVKSIQFESLTGALMLRMAYHYDPVMHGLPHCCLFTPESDCSTSSISNRKMIPTTLYQDILHTLKSIHLLKVDNTILCLLILLYIGHCDTSFDFYISKCDENVDKFTLLLRKYIISVHGPAKAAEVFPKLLMKLCDIKELQMRLDKYVISM